MLLGREFHHIGVKDEKALVLVEDGWTSFGLETIMKLYLSEHTAFQRRGS